MTVADLIKALQEMPGDMPVTFLDDGHDQHGSLILVTTVRVAGTRRLRRDLPDSNGTFILDGAETSEITRILVGRSRTKVVLIS